MATVVHVILARRVRRVVGRSVSDSHEGVCESASGGVVAIGVRVHTMTQIDSSRMVDTILAIVYSSTVGEHMDVGAFWSEFAVALSRSVLSV